MKIHGNAELSLNKRRRLATRIVEEGWPPAKAAAAAEVTTKTASKWARRYKAEGEAGPLAQATAIFEGLVLDPELAEFLTLPAYGQLG